MIKSLRKKMMKSLRKLKWVKLKFKQKLNKSSHKKNKMMEVKRPKITQSNDSLSRLSLIFIILITFKLKSII